MKNEQRRKAENRFINITNVTEFGTEDMEIALGFDGITDAELEDSIWEQIEKECEKRGRSPESVSLYLCLRDGKGYIGIAGLGGYDLHYIPVQLTDAECRHMVMVQSMAVLEEACDYASALMKQYDAKDCLLGICAYGTACIDNLRSTFEEPS